MKIVMTSKKYPVFLCIVRKFLRIVDIIHKLWYIEFVSC